MGLFDAIANVIGTGVGAGIDISNNEYNKQMQSADKNMSFADSRVSNDLLSYYITHGSLDGYKSSVSNQDYNDVADYLSPFLSLEGLQLNKRAQDFAENQFKYSKYVTENSAQIRADDYEKAGFNRLLATGSTASYSPTSMSGGSIPSSKVNRPQYTNLASLGMANALSSVGKNIAEINNINANTELVKQSTVNKTTENDLLLTGIAKSKTEINYINKQADLIEQQINTEFYKGLLTKNQIEYYAQQIAEIEYNLKYAKERGVSTHDTTSNLVKAVRDVVGSMGIDFNSTQGQILTGLGVAIGTGAAAYAGGKNLINGFFNKDKGNKKGK